MWFMAATYLVGLVVVLWVVLEHLFPLLIFESGYKLIYTTTKFPSPLLALCEHLLRQVDIELSSAKEA